MRWRWRWSAHRMRLLYRTEGLRSRAHAPLAWLIAGRAALGDKLGIGLALLAVYLIWGSTYLALRVALEGFPPFLMAGGRFVLAGGAISPGLPVPGAPPPGAPRSLVGGRLRR